MTASRKEIRIAANIVTEYPAKTPSSLLIRRHVAEAFSRFFKASNPTFDEARFMMSVGIKPDTPSE